MIDHVPEQIGKYQVLGVAGKGNMGVVYVGYDPFADRDVAIKVCSPTNEEGQPETTIRLARKMFFNEAQMAGVLDHPNIVKILDAGEDQGEPYIVMEFVDGGKTLSERCAAPSLLPLSDIAGVVTKAARALDYAHRRGIVHRDIKPSNMMLTLEGELKIGDFGVAQHTLGDSTHVLGVVGSPRYMSPEQIQEEEVTHQSDIYSLGAVMFELLTGRAPFTATRLATLMHQITNEPPPSLATLRPDLPPGLEHIVNRALAKRPVDRYASAGEMARNITELFVALAAREVTPDAERQFAQARALHFFNEFSDSELTEVLRASDWRSYTPGELILSEGQSDFSFYVIISGDAQVGRAENAFATLTAGDCLGELGYLAQTNHNTTMAALGPVCVLRITESMMEELTDSCQLRFSRVFLRKLVQRLSRADSPGLKNTPG